MSDKLLENFSNDVKNLLNEFIPNPNDKRGGVGDSDREVVRKEKERRIAMSRDGKRRRENSGTAPQFEKGENSEFQRRTIVDKESPVEKGISTITPEEKRVQDIIYKFKIRLGKLELNNYLKNFVSAMKDFNKNITKYKSSKDDVIKYEAPLKASMVSLIGIMQSMVADLDKIEKEINGD